MLTKDSKRQSWHTNNTVIRELAMMQTGGKKNKSLSHTALNVIMFYIKNI